MIHKVLIQLENDIQAQAEKNLDQARAKNKPLLDEGAALVWESMLDKVFARGQELTQEQVADIEAARKTNLKKE
jgi:ribosomal protein L16 Arg81 hydroxylase